MKQYFVLSRCHSSVYSISFFNFLSEYQIYVLIHPSFSFLGRSIFLPVQYTQLICIIYEEGKCQKHLTKTQNFPSVFIILFQSPNSYKYSSSRKTCVEYKNNPSCLHIFSVNERPTKNVPKQKSQKSDSSFIIIILSEI